jgi:hypothetical protein
MPIRGREGAVLSNSKYKNKNMFDTITGFGYQILVTLVRKPETERSPWNTDLELAKQH